MVNETAPASPTEEIDMTAKTKRKPKQQTVTLHIGEHKIKGLKHEAVARIGR